MAANEPSPDLLVGLIDIRLPSFAPGGLIAEIAVVLGAGMLMACALSVLLPLISRNVFRATPPDLSDQLAATRDLPTRARSVALLHLIRLRDKSAANAFADRLYTRDNFPDPQELERYLTRLENRHG